MRVLFEKFEKANTLGSLVQGRFLDSMPHSLKVNYSCWVLLKSKVWEKKIIFGVLELEGEG